MVSNKWLSKGYRAVIEETVGESPRFARTTLSHRDNDLFSSSPLLFCVFLSFFLSLFIASFFLCYYCFILSSRCIGLSSFSFFFVFPFPLPSSLFVSVASL